MSNIVISQVSKLATTLGMAGDPQELVATLKATAFKGQVTDAQMAALLMVASQYNLNPFTKELYAFPDKGGIVPVVGLDGWSRIINSHPQFDGMDFEQDSEGCTCIIYRRDRSHPIKVTEWMDECKRNTGPWQSHPKRMLRHKAMIQCARLAFGFVGIYDSDEAERIAENKDTKDMGYVQEVKSTSQASPELIAEANAAADRGRESFAAWWKSTPKEAREALKPFTNDLKARTEQADKRGGDVIDMATGEVMGASFDRVMAKINSAKPEDQLHDAISLAAGLSSEHANLAHDRYDERLATMLGAN